jgi:uncharacterized membrane protein
MYQKLEEGTGNVLAYRLTGTLTASELKVIKDDVAQAAETHGKVRLLCEVDGLTGAEPGAIWEDLKGMPQYVRDLERVAVVGDRRWQEWATRAASVLPIAESAYFEPEERSRAWTWIRE